MAQTAQLLVAICLLGFVGTDPPKNTDSAAATNNCYKDGEIVSVRGRILPGINGGTYFELLKQICIDYPSAPQKLSALSLNIIGSKLPHSIYLEVVGRIRDASVHHVFGLDLYVVSYQDVNSEVLQDFKIKAASCAQWQDDNRKRIIERIHGGDAFPISTNGSNGIRRCGIWGVDREAPHRSITLWRPDL